MQKKCPRCGERLIEIIYGMPSSELFEAEERGEIVLGGCEMDEYRFHCNKCNMDFTRDLSKSQKSFSVDEE